MYFKLKKMNIAEIFYSLQGEGANVGKPAIFVRLAGCNMDCWFCDTDWKNGSEMSVTEILHQIENFPTNFIVWTGGEPTLQLNNNILSHFSHYCNAIETNGTNPVPSKIDYIACSPKVSTEILRQNFDFADEFRFHYYDENKNTLPKISDLPRADNYFLSPVMVGNDVFDPKNTENISSCINFIKQNPQWRLSFQTHKFLKIM